MSDLVEAGDRWGLPVAQEDVAQLRVDWAMTLLLNNGISIRIEQAFTFISEGGSEQLISSGAGPERFAPVLVLARSTMSEGLAFDDDRLLLSFEDGASVSVPPAQDHESWTAAGPSDMLIVSTPGGELAI